MSIQDEQREAIDTMRKIKRLCRAWPPDQAEDRLDDVRELLGAKKAKRSSKSERDRAERGGRDRG